MTEQIALQLYSVREQTAVDYANTLRRVAAMGYKAVETAGFSTISVHAAKALFDELGLSVCAAHSKLPLGNAEHEVLEIMDALDCKMIVCPSLDADTYFSSVDGIKKACEMLNDASAVAQEAGLALAYHNHWFELALVDGKPAYQHMLDYLEPSVLFELDLYWVKVGGLDPKAVLEHLGERAALLHVKDGPADNRDSAMTAVGEGVMDIPSLLNVSKAQWHIVELDRCDTDMLEAVEKSYNYLKDLVI